MKQLSIFQLCCISRLKLIYAFMFSAIFIAPEAFCDRTYTIKNRSGYELKVTEIENQESCLNYQLELFHTYSQRQILPEGKDLHISFPGLSEENLTEGIYPFNQHISDGGSIKANFEVIENDDSRFVYVVFGLGLKGGGPEEDRESAIALSIGKAAVGACLGIVATFTPFGWMAFGLGVLGGGITGAGINGGVHAFLSEPRDFDQSENNTQALKGFVGGCAAAVVGPVGGSIAKFCGAGKCITHAVSAAGGAATSKAISNSIEEKPILEGVGTAAAGGFLGGIAAHHVDKFITAKLLETKFMPIDGPNFHGLEQVEDVSFGFRVLGAGFLRGAATGAAQTIIGRSIDKIFAAQDQKPTVKDLIFESFLSAAIGGTVRGLNDGAMYLKQVGYIKDRFWANVSKLRKNLQNGFKDAGYVQLDAIYVDGSPVDDPALDLYKQAGEMLNDLDLYDAIPNADSMEKFDPKAARSYNKANPLGSRSFDIPKEFLLSDKDLLKLRNGGTITNRAGTLAFRDFLSLLNRSIDQMAAKTAFFASSHPDQLYKPQFGMMQHAQSAVKSVRKKAEEIRQKKERNLKNRQAAQAEIDKIERKIADLAEQANKRSSSSLGSYLISKAGDFLSKAGLHAQKALFALEITLNKSDAADIEKSWGELKSELYQKNKALKAQFENLKNIRDAKAQLLDQTEKQLLVEMDQITENLQIRINPKRRLELEANFDALEKQRQEVITEKKNLTVKAIIRNREKEFFTVQVPADGDCFFHALDIPREFTHRLFDRSFESKKEATLIEAISYDIVSQFQIDPERTRLLIGDLADLIDINDYAASVQRIINKPRIISALFDFRNYLNAFFLSRSWTPYNMGFSGEKVPSLLDAIALITKTEIYILGKDESSESNQLNIRSHARPESFERTVYMVHTNENTHFNTLIPLN